MELNSVIDDIFERISCQGARMSEEEANILKANLNNEDAICAYALGLLINSSVRIKKMFFKGYDDLQNEAFTLLNDAIEKDNSLAIYWMAQIKCGLFGKFPRYPEEGKHLFEKYYALTNDETIKNTILDRWEEYDSEMKGHFDDMRIYEVMNDLRNHGFSNFSSHDDAYYEEEDS